MSYCEGCARLERINTRLKKDNADLIDALQRSLDWLASYPASAADAAYYRAVAAIRAATGASA